LCVWSRRIYPRSDKNHTLTQPFAPPTTAAFHRHLDTSSASMREAPFPPPPSTVPRAGRTFLFFRTTYSRVVSGLRLISLINTVLDASSGEIRFREQRSSTRTKCSPYYASNLHLNSTANFPIDHYSLQSHSASLDQPHRCLTSSEAHVKTSEQHNCSCCDIYETFERNPDASSRLCTVG
jgi:hypothetical protein